MTEPVFYKNPNIAVILSFLIPGLGQMYNGEFGMAIFMWVTLAVCAGLMVYGVGLVLVPIAWIWCMIDAHAGAKKFNSEARNEEGIEAEI